MSEAGKRTRSDAALNPLMEERLKEEEDKPDSRLGPVLPLKKGEGQMEAGWVRAWEEDLRRLLEKHPDHFRALLALAEGRGEEVSRPMRRDLRAWEYLLRDGSIHPHVKAIMSAGVRETPDGLCVVDSLDVRTSEDAAVVRRFDKQQEAQRRKGPERLRRWLFEGDRGEDKGRS
jgi:hypothetical protein